MSALTALFLVLLGCVIAPAVCHFVPHRLLPEVVLLLAYGVLIGPHGLGWVNPGPQLGLLREIGMAFLFLLAGYEVNQRDLVSKAGRNATFTWVVSLILAAVVVGLRGRIALWSLEGAATVIAMTATALGTILPILKDRKILGTPQGRYIMTQGAVGEVGPIILIALVLSANSPLISLICVILFILATVAIMVARKRIVEIGKRLVDMVHFEAETTAQLTVRMASALLVGLVALADGMGIDLVLGAFAAGFIIRQTVPNGREEFDSKLDGIAYGFFIPIFFVLSGTTIDPSVVAGDFTGWLLFLVALIAVRGVPIFFASFVPQTDDIHRHMSMRQRISAACYSTTNLPIIVAVTHLAVNQGAMTETTASTLVFAGAASVLVMPFLAFILGGEAKQAKESTRELK
ncbi:MAG: cation:proton antiporter [Actinomycetaceae bacterium]|nr:cation:proton antiporter [Actinomycetaceae bacterium]MDU0969514.1 cation:proton antiporter [Actinomycetaceae bacterium]